MRNDAGDEVVRDPDRCLAAYARQYMRAAQAWDGDAASLMLGHLRSLMTRLLESRLADAPGWDAKARWLDGLASTDVAAAPPNRLRISGPMLWGLVADAGGPQWAEPFQAELYLSPENGGLANYRLRFGDRELDEYRAPLGDANRPAGENLKVSFHNALAALAAGKVVWAYTFTKGGSSRETPLPDHP